MLWFSTWFIHKPKVEKLVNDFVENCRTFSTDDALNVLNLNILQKREHSTVITPHPGEFARLCNCDILDVQQDRVNRAIEFSKQMNVICVLKGAGTVIACPDGKYYITHRSSQLGCCRVWRCASR